MSAPNDLVSLGFGRGKLRPGPVASVFRIDAVIGRPLDINSAYRDYDEQMRAYNAYRRDPKNNPLALHPDQSWHCKGMALDTDDRWAIFAEHGWRFVVPTEPWHAQYYANLDQHYGQPASSGAKPFVPTQPQEDKLMLIIVALSNSKDGLIREGWTFSDDFTSPLALISADELGALNYWDGKNLPYRRAEWTGEQLRELIAVRGMRPVNVNTGRPDYTGPVVY